VIARQRRPVAGLLNTGQLARAAEDLVGCGRVSASARTGWWDGQQALRDGALPEPPRAQAPDRPHGRRHLRQTLKDVRRIAWNLGRRSPPPGLLPPLFVWQRLDPFFAEGPRLARRFRVPLVVGVHALTVCERRKWGAGRLPLDPLLALGERWVLRRADCICLVSESLRSELVTVGLRGDDSRLLVTPNQVDPSLFRPMPAAARTRRRELGISDDDFVIGWSGSFRSFHRLDLVLEIHRQLADRGNLARAVWLFLGDGTRRRRLEEVCAAAGMRAVFPGLVEYTRVPEYLSAMDVGLVLGSEEAGAFHYSPVKLRELLACGVPVAASDVGEISTLMAGTPLAGLLGTNPRELAEAIERVARDGALGTLGDRARELALRGEGWTGQLERVLGKIGR
jgi:glycosyltransferase involved in cell wall biosynthesis